MYFLLNMWILRCHSLVFIGEISFVVIQKTHVVIQQTQRHATHRGVDLEYVREVVCDLWKIMARM